MFCCLKSIAQQYYFKNYTVDEGLSQSQILSLCQSKSGYLWIGTNGGGLNKFDGKQFYTYTKNDGLINNCIYSITETKKGELILGTNAGISIYNGFTFKNYISQNGLPPHPSVYNTIEDSDGIIWIGTQSGVYQLINNTIKRFEGNLLLNEALVFTIFEDQQKNIWFGTSGAGVFCYNKQRKDFLHYSKTNGLNDDDVRAINQSKSGEIYIGTLLGLNKINKNKDVIQLEIKALENDAVLDIIFDSNNNFWLCCSNGVIEYDGVKYNHYTQKNGLPNNTIWCGIQDRERNFWFGTKGFGLSKLAGRDFVCYNSNNLLNGDYVNCLFKDSKENIWIGTRGTGLSKLTNGTVTKIVYDAKSPKNTLISNEVQCIEEDKDGKLYFGTNNGLSIYDGKNFKNIQKENGLPSDVVFSALRKSNNEIWLGTKNGICKIINNKIIPLLIPTNVVGNEREIPVYCIFEDSKKNTWLGTEIGVITFDGINYSTLNQENGTRDRKILSIAEDKQGYIWFATDDGIFGYNNNTFYQIKTEDGLSSNKVYTVLLDDVNNLWIGTNKGVDKFNLTIYHSIKKIKISNYGKEEGFTGIECNWNAKLKEKNGKLWFGTINGAMQYKPQYSVTNNKESITKIIGLRLFFNKEDSLLRNYSKGIDSITGLPKDLELPYNLNHITFDFIGICFTNSNKVKYQFKLNGIDDDWFQPTTKPEAPYSSLPPGKYTFYVKSMNNEGLWNRTPTEFSFTILPPWWATWWFYGTISISSILILYLIIWSRINSLKKTQQKLERQVELRTTELRNEKEKVELINKEVITQKAIIESKSKDITDSIKYAKNIQEALLPPLQNFYNEIPNSFILYLPKDIVSGDFYWFAKRNNIQYIAAVDCTGHGVPGAFMSIIGNTLLNEIVNEKNIYKPSDILEELHQGVKDALKQNESISQRRDGMDITLCAINFQENIIQYAGANRPLWMVKTKSSIENKIEIIKPTKAPIGGLEFDNESKRTYANHTIQIEKGDLYYLFSDGYADQFGGPKGKKFMLANLQKLILTICNKPLKEQEQILKDTFMNWKAEHEQVDDVLVIGFSL
jgi:ligand-binding sensor domain-containing protein